MSYHHAHGLRASSWLLGWVLVCAGAHAHVALDSPNGGQSFTGGAEVTIEWHVEVEHNTLDWDLWFSTESDEGPWHEIAVDLAAGDKTAGAAHSFDWSVPSLNASDAWVRVRQDNAGEDYFDVSDSSFSIVGAAIGSDFTGDGNIDGADLEAWQQGFGSTSAAPSDGDADLDRDVDGADFIAWQADFGGVAAVADTQSVPEPAATLLLLIGMTVMLWPWR